MSYQDTLTGQQGHRPGPLIVAALIPCLALGGIHTHSLVGRGQGLMVVVDPPFQRGSPLWRRDVMHQINWQPGVTAKHYKVSSHPSAGVEDVVIRLDQERQLMMPLRLSGRVQGTQQGDQRLIEPLAGPVPLRVIGGFPAFYTPIHLAQLSHQSGFKGCSLVRHEPLWAPKGLNQGGPQGLDSAGCGLVFSSVV